MEMCGHMSACARLHIYRVFSAKVYKKNPQKEKKKLQLLVLQQDLHIAKQEEKYSAVQGEVSEKLVMEASVAIEKKLNCHKVLHMERR